MGDNLGLPGGVLRHHGSPQEREGHSQRSRVWARRQKLGWGHRRQRKGGESRRSWGAGTGKCILTWSLWKDPPCAHLDFSIMNLISDFWLPEHCKRIGLCPFSHWVCEIGHSIIRNWVCSVSAYLLKRRPSLWGQMWMGLVCLESHTGGWPGLR